MNCNELDCATAAGLRGDLVTCQIRFVGVLRFEMQLGYLQMPKLVDGQIKPDEETGAADEEECDVVRRDEVLHKVVWIHCRISRICSPH